MAILSARAKMVREQTEAGQEEDSVRARSNSDQIFLVFKQIFFQVGVLRVPAGALQRGAGGAAGGGQDAAAGDRGAVIGGEQVT